MKDRETAFITGGSSGIGYELSKLFAENGYNLVLVARREEKLLEIAEGFAKSVVADLSNPQAPEKVYNQLKKDGTSVDILVNNAGFGN